MAKPKRSVRVVIGVLVLSVLFIAFVEGMFNPLWIWNAAPVVASLGLLLFFLRRSRPDERPLVAGAAAFAIVAVALVLAFHFSWLFDIDRTATASSTSGVAFAFVPIWAFLVGGVAFFLVSLGSVLIRSRRRRPQ